jgi:predicted amidohydrolase
MRGGSLLVSPLGRVLAGPMWEQEGVLAAELDIDEIARGRIDLTPSATTPAGRFLPGGGRASDAGRQ